MSTCQRPSSAARAGSISSVPDLPVTGILRSGPDRPFDSNATYNILFAPPKALRTAADARHAQIQAFEDSWHWNDRAEDAFDQVARSGDTRAFELLDPFCGCGTAVHAAEKLRRRWIGIDVTHLATSLVERRLQAAFPSIAFGVEGTPEDLASALDLVRRDKDQFQWWAVSMVGAVPFGGRRKGADGGQQPGLF